MSSIDTQCSAADLLQKYLERGSMEDLDASIAKYRCLINDDTQLTSQCLEACTGLQSALYELYKVLGAQSDLDELVGCNDLVNVDFAPSTSARDKFALHLSLRGAGLRLRFSMNTSTDTGADLEEAVALCERAVQICPVNSVHRPICLEELGRAMRIRYQQSAVLADALRATELHQQVLSLPGTPPHTRSQNLQSLSILHWLRYSRSDGVHHLNDAIALAEEGISLQPRDHPACASLITNLGVALQDRFREAGDLADLERAISLHEHRLELQRSTDNAHHFGCLSNLANALSMRFNHSGNIEDLHRCINTHREAANLSHTYNYYPDRQSMCLHNLGAGLGQLFEFELDISRIEEALPILREALSLRPPGHPLHSRTCQNLGCVLTCRYSELGDFADLDEAITYHQESLSLYDSVDHPSRTAAVVDLAKALRWRYKHSRDAADWDYVLSLVRPTLQVCDRNSPHHTPLLCAMGEALLMQNEHSDNVTDLEEVRDGLESARSSGVATSPMQIDVLLLLGRIYQARYAHFQRAEDVLLARDLITESVTHVVDGDARRYTYYMHLTELYVKTGTPIYNVHTALTFLSSILDDDHRSAQVRLNDAMGILDEIEDNADLFSFDDPTQNLLFDIYHAVVGLLPLLAYFGLNIHSRLRSLARADSISLRAASYAIFLSRPARALELLEQGRGIFWSQALQLRTQFDDVPEDLGAQLKDLTQRLERRTYSLNQSASNDAMEREAAARNRKETEQFKALVAQVRAEPGLERFLLPEPITSLVQAAIKGPIVVLLSRSASCEAITIDPSGKVQHVALDAVTADWLIRTSITWKKISDRSRKEGSERLNLVKGGSSAPRSIDRKENRILAKLWTQIVRPILLSISMTPATGRERPRLWWIPTGHFSFLPLHAAGIQGGTESERLSGYAVSSYSPTISVLLNARRAYIPLRMDSANVLLGAVPKSSVEGFAELPQTLEEIRDLREIVSSESLLESDGEADMTTDGLTVQAFLDLLPRAHVLHLACHGEQDLEDPLNSHFIMRDGVVSIASLMPLPLPNAFFAFLSACETAKGDETHPDQLIHLAATMLFAGFKSVVGTMWSMNDYDGPFVAKIVYQQLFEKGSEYLDPDAIPYALDDTVRQLRDTGVSASSWATYIHLGM